jgi:hypothetical protein
MKQLLFLLLILFAFFSGIAQDSTRVTKDRAVQITRDTIIMEAQDTIRIKSYAKRYSPRKALLYAAILPGLGQIYNKKYWKLPLVYGGFYLLIDQGVIKYNNIYTTYKGYLFYNIEHNITGSLTSPNSGARTTDQLRRIVDRARRERDFMIIMTAGLYLLQMVDAHVDAHLKEFDLNPNLHARLEPTLNQDPVTGRQTGISLIFRF